MYLLNSKLNNIAIIFQGGFSQYLKLGNFLYFEHWLRIKKTKNRNETLVFMIYSARSSFKNIHIFWCEKFGIKNGVTLSLNNRKYDSFVFFLFVSLKYKDFFLPRDPYNTHIIPNRTAPQFTFSWQVIFSELTSNSKWLRIFLVKTLVWFFFQDTV